MSAGSRRRSVGVALGAGAVVALGMACGGAQRSAPVASAQSTGTDSLTSMPPDRRAAHSRIDAFDADIATEMSQLGLARPPATALGGPPCVAASTCTAQTMSVGTEPPEADPACTPGKSEVCRDTCTFSDSICSNAGKICAIAGDLGALDGYADDKCATGKSSCAAASERCCRCV